MGLLKTLGRVQFGNFSFLIEIHFRTLELYKLSVTNVEALRCITDLFLKQFVLYLDTGYQAFKILQICGCLYLVVYVVVHSDVSFSGSNIRLGIRQSG